MTTVAAVPPAAQAQDFRSSLAEAFGAATAGGVVSIRSVAIAGRLLQLRFADPALETQMMPALEHLSVRASSAAPDLVIDVWSSSEAPRGAEPPRLTAPRDVALPPGAFLHSSVGGLHISYQPARQILNVFDATARRGWFWVADGRLPYWERSAPLRHVIHWWMREFGVQQLHSSAVGDDHGAVLIVGRSGSGKSTTALAAVEAGLCYLGDDYVLAADHPQPRIFSTYCSGKLTATQIKLFPHLAGVVTNPTELADEKALVYLTHVQRYSVATSRRLAAVLVPTINGGIGTTAEPVGRIAALAALAPSTLVEVFTAGDAGLRRMRAIVEQVPCYSLLLGRDLASIGPTIQRILDAHRGTSA